MRLVIKQTKLSDSIIISVLCCFYFALNSLSVSATSSISISTPASIDLELTPTDQGAATAQTSNVVVKTSGTEGFKVLLSSDNPNLVNHLHPEKQIRSITTETTSINLPLNTWGIYLGASSPSSSTLFSPVPTTLTEFARQDLADASGTYKLAVAVKADTSLPAGTYQNQLVISVVASLPEKVVTDLTTATYMQDVTPEVCKNSKIWESEADSVILIDKRDNKTYKVARLKDGNCWMQEDLELDLMTSKPLITETSDVESTWTPTANVTAKGDYWYYTWWQATAGSGDSIGAGVIASYSICPKGWQLPMSSENKSGSISTLLAAYNNMSPTLSPLGFNYTGYYIWDGAPQRVGSEGEYWTSTAGQLASGHYSTAAMFYFYNGTTYSGYLDLRDHSCALRCVTVSNE